MNEKIGFPVKMELYETLGGESVSVNGCEELGVFMTKKYHIRPNNFPHGDKRLGMYC